MGQRPEGRQRHTYINVTVPKAKKQGSSNESKSTSVFQHQFTLLWPPMSGTDNPAIEAMVSSPSSCQNSTKLCHDIHSVPRLTWLWQGFHGLRKPAMEIHDLRRDSMVTSIILVAFLHFLRCTLSPTSLISLNHLSKYTVRFSRLH